MLLVSKQQTNVHFFFFLTETIEATKISVATNLVKDIEVSRQDPNLILVTQKSFGTGILWKSTDGGLNWTQINIPAASSTMYIALNEEHELFLARHFGANNVITILLRVNQICTFFKPIWFILFIHLGRSGSLYIKK